MRGSRAGGRIRNGSIRNLQCRLNRHVSKQLKSQMKAKNQFSRDYKLLTTPFFNLSRAGCLTKLGGAGDLAHASSLVVAHGLHELLLSVHDERPVVSDRLDDRHSGQEQ